MKKLKVGMVGLGMGAANVRGLQTHPQVEVAAVADKDPERLKTRGTEKLGIPRTFTAAEEMFENGGLDAVVIAVPNKFHKPLTIAALEAGLHVCCEKPMAMNTGEAREMKAAADETGKRLMVNFSSRFSEQAWSMKKEVDAGTFGDIYYARSIWLRRRGMPGFGGWFGQKDLAGGGPLIDLGVHRLDLALWLMGYPKPTWVMGSTYDHIATEIARREGKTFDVEDLAVGMIKFENGATLELEASWAGNIKEKEHMSTRLLGTKAGLLQHNIGEGYDFTAEIYIERNGMQYDMALHPPVPGAHNSMYHFADAILNDKPFIPTAEQGIIVMELLDAIYESAATDAPVKID